MMAYLAGRLPLAHPKLLENATSSSLMNNCRVAFSISSWSMKSDGLLLRCHTHNKVIIHAVGFRPSSHDPMIVPRDDNHMIHALGLELVNALQVGGDVLL